MMKKIAFLIFCTILIFQLSIAQNVDSVLQKFYDANGGLDRLRSISTMQISSAINLEQFGASINLTTIRDKNKLYRMQSSSPMSESESYTVIYDTAGYMFTPAMHGPMGDVDAAMTKLNDEDFKMQAYQKDCEGFFSPLVDYQQKGSKAELVGNENVSGAECSKVKITTINLQEMIFYISNVTGQVKRMQISAKIALQMVGMGSMMRMIGGNRENSKAANRKFDVDFEKYKLFSGIPFPTKISVQMGMRSVVLENTNVVLNQPIAKKWYDLKQYLFK